MKTLQLITFTITIMFFFFSCESSLSKERKIENEISNSQGIIKNISVFQFKEMINEDAIILDVRRLVEYNAAHINNAVNINYFDDDFVTQVMRLDKTKILLIHCASGGRSSRALHKLKEKGFPAVYNMLGGITAWKKSGFPIVK